MRSLSCAVHKHSSLVPVEDHHIHPREFHGLTVKTNMVRLCANAHGDVHYYLSRLLKTGGKVPSAESKTYGYMVRRLAQRGYSEIMEYATELSKEIA